MNCTFVSYLAMRSMLSERHNWLKTGGYLD